jgi:Mg-chelatase subunit ChlD
VDCPQEQEPQVLVISGRPQAASFLERLWRTKKVSLEQAPAEDLPRYPLIVLDGLPLRSLGGELSSILADLHARGAASLLFVADSPGFGRQGDNPPVEQMLPTLLTPRSLQYLPDLSILIMLDVSASMMGDKLSLAKVSTLELAKNLKDSDRVSLLCFWDKYRFLNDFVERKALDTEMQLTPLVAQGGTDIHPALEEALRRLSALPASSAEKHLILLSDGKTKEADFAPLIRRAVAAQITISTVAVGEEVDAELLSRLARQTDGHAYRVLSLDEIPAVIFEDRKQIARSSFATDRFAIRDFAGRAAGEVSGMSLFAPKPDAQVLFRNQFEDPLLAVSRGDGGRVMMFLSDLYGRHSGGFLSQPAAARTVVALLDGVLQSGRLKLRIGEVAGKISFTVGAEGLLKPELHLYRDNRAVERVSLRAGAFGLASGSFLPPEPGEYVAVLYDRGRPAFRFPVFCNGTLEGRETSTEAALRHYRVRRFRTVRAGGLHLVLSFLASLAVTFLSRRVRAAGAGPA